MYQEILGINPLSSPSAGAPAPKYGNVNYRESLPRRAQRVNIQSIQYHYSKNIISNKY